MPFPEAWRGICPAGGASLFVQPGGAGRGRDGFSWAVTVTVTVRVGRGRDGFSWGTIQAERETRTAWIASEPKEQVRNFT